MAKFKALSRGTQLVLVAGPLLFVSLFFTWQNVEVDYGPAGVATMPLDGFDAWGLLLALLADRAVALVVAARASRTSRCRTTSRGTDDVSRSVPRRLAVAVVKSLTDSGSSWASYGVRRPRRCGGGRDVPRLGGGAQERASRCSRASDAGSAQPFDEEDAVLAGAVVVRHDPLDLEPERLVERDRALVHR